MEMKELFLKLIKLLPKNSDGKELAKHGIFWSVYYPDSGDPVLIVYFAGLEIRIMQQSDALDPFINWETPDDTLD